MRFNLTRLFTLTLFVAIVLALGIWLEPIPVVVRYGLATMFTGGFFGLVADANRKAKANSPDSWVSYL